MNEYQDNARNGSNYRDKTLGLSLLALTIAGTLILALSLDPVAQPLSYHGFADGRRISGVDNFWNVVSNLPFFIFGLSGFAYVLIVRPSGAQRSWLVFFAAMTLVSIGSAWYHLAPDNGRLLWDRLPIGVLMAALFVALLTEHVGPAQERWLVPMVLLGAASVMHWHYTDDLRLYAWVQVWTSFAVLLFLLLFKPLYAGRRWLLAGFVFFLLSRIAEYYDVTMFRGTREAIGGHAIKHLLAGLAPLAIQIMLMRRGKNTP